MLAYDFPLLSLMWTMFVFFLWIAWIIILFRTVVDIFKSADLSGIAKAAWLLFVVAIPWLGVLVYLIARGNKMVEREMHQAVKQQQAQIEAQQKLLDDQAKRIELLKQLVCSQNPNAVICREEK